MFLFNKTTVTSSRFPLFSQFLHHFYATQGNPAFNMHLNASLVVMLLWTVPIPTTIYPFWIEQSKHTVLIKVIVPLKLVKTGYVQYCSLLNIVQYCFPQKNDCNRKLIINALLFFISRSILDGNSVSIKKTITIESQNHQGW